MTPTQAALCALLDTPVDDAFAREYLERGGHYQTFHGDPAKQNQWRRELPVRFVAHAQLTREERAS